MAGYRGQQGRKLKASTIVERLRDRQQTPPTRSRAPAPPPHLSPAGVVEWDRVARSLRKAGLLTNLDVTALAAYCTENVRHVEAEAMLDGPPRRGTNCAPPAPREPDPPKDRSCIGPRHLGHPFGKVIIDRSGKLVASPYLRISNEAMVLMGRFLIEFGMTPASRTRIPREQAGTKPRRRAQAAAQPGTDPRLALPVIEGGNQTA